MIAWGKMELSIFCRSAVVVFRSSRALGFYLRSGMIKSASFGGGGGGGLNKSNCGGGGFSLRKAIAAGSVFFNQSSLHWQTGQT